MKSAPALVCVLFSLLITGCSSGTNSSTTGTTATTVTPAATTVTVTSIAPTVVATGATPVNVTVNGTGFTSATAVQVGGAIVASTFVSSTQVTATVPATQLASGSMLAIVALNGTVTSAATPVSLEVDNPVPAITQLLPATFTAVLPSSITSSALVAVNGSNFVPTTSIQVNGTARATTYVSATQVNVILNAGDLGTAGSLSLNAVNSAPKGGSSAAASIAVNNPLPGALTLAPTSSLSGITTPTTVTVTGSNFFPTSVVQVGASSRPTTFVSSTQLTFQLTVADQAVAGLLGISVLNPTPGGGGSRVTNFTVIASTPTPVITSVSPTSFVAGSPATSIAVYGTNLTPNNPSLSGFLVSSSTTPSTIQWNGTDLVTSTYSVYNSNTGTYTTSLIGNVPANLIATTGSASIRVSSPASLVSLSNVLPATIVNPPVPTLTGISPNYGAINTGATVTLTGTGFTTNSTVTYNGNLLTATYVNTTTITAVLPASLNTLPGNGSFTVTTPAPGGGTSGSQVFSAYIPLGTNSMIYNPANGLLYASVPSSAGAPYGNSVVSVDPATGVLGTPILVGSEPNKLAVTADGKFLWVGLDGASAVRKVDLTANTAGLQFTLNSTAVTTPSALALAALPGATDSVVVSLSGSPYNYPYYVGIYDSGVLRSAPASSNGYNTQGYALAVDGARSEIYVAGQNVYNTYTYSSTGLTLKASNLLGTYATPPLDEVQLANGILYTDYGKAYDAESGGLVGSFYNTATALAAGPMIADLTSNKTFILDNSNPSYTSSYNQIQVFNTANYTSSAGTIPVNVPSYLSNSPYYTIYPNHLVRWGANGLAFRTQYGIYSLQSNVVNDLSATKANLGVAIVASGPTTTGTSTVYTATMTNNGPSPATNVILTAQLPTTGSMLSVTPSAGTCNGTNCSLGTLASGASTTVVYTIAQITPGASTLTAQVSGSTTDAVSTNNTATSTVTITGSPYNALPSLTAITPTAIQAGSTDTIITLTGSGFTSASSVLMGGSALTSTYIGPTQLTATVPAAKLAALGWAAITVSNAAPGGGTSATLPLTVYSVTTVGLNHMIYDPFTRKIMATVGSGSSTITGNSILAITPETATLGTPIPIGSQPTNLALTPNGQVLYTLLTGSSSVARFNMLTQQADFTVPNIIAANSNSVLRDLAVQPGTENTVAIDQGQYAGITLYDFNPTTKTATARPQQSSSYYTGTCLAFPNATSLVTTDANNYSVALDRYIVTSQGVGTGSYPPYTTSSLKNFSCFKLSGNLAFANIGGVANISGATAIQAGVFPGLSSNSNYGIGPKTIEPDLSLKRVFSLSNLASPSYSAPVDSITAFNLDTFLPSSVLPISFAAIEGSSSAATGVDIVRWGQDGLAVLTTGGHLYLLRGPVVTPQLLNTNTSATLSASSATTITHGAGNTLLNLTGSNFVPGVAVTWNGSYRTTTIVDATHVTIAIPAADLANAGTASLVATNPGAPASTALTITIN